MSSKAQRDEAPDTTQTPHKSSEHAILYVSTFPPRKCGIATFTQDVVNSMDEMLAPAVKSKVLALNPNDVVHYTYPKKVVFQLVQENEQDYVRVAKEINKMHDIRLVNIQHEFGIFGGERGSYLIPFLKTLKKPKVINFHTVLPDPDEFLHRTVIALAENVNAITVMTSRSKQILVNDYALSSRKIRLIPHGIHSQPFLSSRQAKAALGFSDRVVFSTFGLLNRGKGLEYIIEALPEVVRRFPNFVYIYFGGTHPVVAEQEGESYRNEIIDKIYQLGLFDYVRLYNKFFPLGELLRFLRATDVYISPGLEPNQAVSGTLSYALGTGRPVISTAFANAQELITDDVGLLVDFRNPQAYTDAMIKLLEDEALRLQMGRNAYFKTRWMTWPNVAVRELRLFSEYAKSLGRISKKKSLPKIRLDHLTRLTDGYGIVQFSKLTHPDPRSGYTLDDNARALTAVVEYYAKFGGARKVPMTTKRRRDLQNLMRVYLGFIRSVVQNNGEFHNFVKGDRSLDQSKNGVSNLEDANTRAILALTRATTTGILPQTIRREAAELLELRCRHQLDFRSPRAIARWSKALCLLIRRKKEYRNLDLEQSLRTNCARLIDYYRDSASPEWQWFEEYLTYSNAIMPEALILAYEITGEQQYLDVGTTTLEFLIRESFGDGIYTPVGQEGWYHKFGKKNGYDQQPEEVKTMVCALNTCHRVTKDDRYEELARTAFYWFLGDNTLNQVVYDSGTGGCYDGVGKKTINLNQGAESTISYLLARLEFE